MNSERANYLIIGNGPAGIAAACAIREINRLSNITILSEEDMPGYSRVLLTHLISGKITEKQLILYDHDFYCHYNIKLFNGARVEKIAPDQQCVFLEDGKKIAYDHLLIATGARPAFPPIPGIHRQGVFPLRSLKHARCILHHIPPYGTALLIGGGMISLNTACALLEKGYRVILFEIAPQILPQNLDQKAAQRLEKHFKKQGMTILTSVQINRIDSYGSKVSIILKEGDRYDGDIIIVGTGVIPAIEPFQQSSMACDRGILVNRRMQTTIPRIYAAGDVCQAYDLIRNEKMLNPLWPTAVAQGKIAGHNMAGLKVEYQGNIAVNSADFRGLPIMSMGISNPKNKKYHTLIYEGEYSYRKLIFEDRRLIGAIFVGDVQYGGMYLASIRKKQYFPDLDVFLVSNKDIRRYMIGHLYRNRKNLNN